MNNIYEQYDKAFNRVSAFVIARDGERVATVAIKFPLDGESRLDAYVQWFGLEMVRGHAGVYGYDKRSAAVSNALGNLPALYPIDRGLGGITGYDAFRDARGVMDSQDWTRALEKAGFQVWQAV